MKITAFVIVDKDKEIIMDPYSPNNNLAIFEIFTYAEDYRKKHGGSIYTAEIEIKKKL